MDDGIVKDGSKYPPIKDRRVLKAVILTIVIITILLGSLIGGLYYRAQIYSQGVQDGATMLYAEIIGVVGKCESWPITYQNQSVNMIIYECLQRGEE